LSHVKVNLLYRLSRLLNRILMKAAPLSRSVRRALLEISRAEREEELGERKELLETLINLPWEWESFEYSVVRTFKGSAKGVSAFQRSIEKSFALASLLAGVLTVVSLLVLVIVYAP